MYKTITIFVSVQVKTGLKLTRMYVAFTLWMHMHERNIGSFFFFFFICDCVTLQSLLVPTLCAQSPHEQRQTCLNATYHKSYIVNISNFIIGNQNWQCWVFSHRLISFYAYLFHVFAWNLTWETFGKYSPSFLDIILGLDFSGSPYDCLRKSVSMWD